MSDAASSAEDAAPLAELRGYEIARARRDGRWRMRSYQGTRTD